MFIAAVVMCDQMITHTMEFSKEKLEFIRTSLLKKQLTLSTAESVTAGLLQGAFSQASDARLFFEGGVTAFNVAQKCRLLDVEPIYAQQENGVSERIVSQMATHATKLFCSQIGIAVVGYAAPVPEKEIDHPFAYYAITARDELVAADRIDPPGGDSLSVQLYYVDRILDALVKLLGSKPGL